MPSAFPATALHSVYCKIFACPAEDVATLVPRRSGLDSHPQLMSLSSCPPTPSARNTRRTSPPRHPLLALVGRCTSSRPQRDQCRSASNSLRHRSAPRAPRCLTTRPGCPFPSGASSPSAGVQRGTWRTCHARRESRPSIRHHRHSCPPTMTWS